MEIKQIEISAQPLQRRRVIISALLRATQGRERVFHKYEEAHWIPALRLKHQSESKSAPNFITPAYKCIPDFASCSCTTQANKSKLCMYIKKGDIFPGRRGKQQLFFPTCRPSPKQWAVMNKQKQRQLCPSPGTWLNNGHAHAAWVHTVGQNPADPQRNPSKPWAGSEGSNTPAPLFSHRSPACWLEWH